MHLFDVHVIRKKKKQKILRCAAHVYVTAGNAVCSWGRGEDGQLGHGDAEDRLQPTFISALDGQKVESVTCGADHSTALSGLQVYSWGWYVLLIYYFSSFLLLAGIHSFSFLTISHGQTLWAFSSAVLKLTTLPKLIIPVPFCTSNQHMYMHQIVRNAF